MKSAMRKSIVIIEDEISVRGRLEKIIQTSEKFQVLASFMRVEPALDFMQANDVWLAILDLGLPGIAHTEAVKCIRAAHPEIEILVHTVFDADENVFSALQHGATDYLIKDDKPESILNALDELAAGGSPMSFAIARKVMEFFRRFEPPKKILPALEPLTAREQEVLRLLYDGNKYRNIAEKLGVSKHTVHDHIKHIYQKLQVHSRVELMHRMIDEDK